MTGVVKGWSLLVVTLTSGMVNVVRENVKERHQEVKVTVCSMSDRIVKEEMS